MGKATVVCERCSCVAIIVSTEGELFPADPKAGPKLVHTIDCPTCGRREQSESAHKSTGK